MRQDLGRTAFLRAVRALPLPGWPAFVSWGSLARPVIASGFQGLGKTRPACALVFSAFAFILSGALCPNESAWGLENNRDYYAKSPDRETILKHLHQNHLEPGKAHTRNRRFGPALADFHFVLDYFPNHPLALMALSELCLGWKSPRCDIGDRFDRAIAINPGATETYVVYGIHLHRSNQLDKAVEAYLRAIALNPNSLNAHYNLGLAYFDLKQYELANEQAQISYALGAPLPGLRERLKRVGYWRPASQTSSAPAAGDVSPNPAGSAPQAPAQQAPQREVLGGGRPPRAGTGTGTTTTTGDPASERSTR